MRILGVEVHTHGSCQLEKLLLDERNTPPELYEKLILPKISSDKSLNAILLPLTLLLTPQE